MRIFSLTLLWLGPLGASAVDPMGYRPVRPSIEARLDPNHRALSAPARTKESPVVASPPKVQSARLIETNAGLQLEVIFLDHHGQTNVTYKSVAAVVNEALLSGCGLNLER